MCREEEAESLSHIRLRCQCINDRQAFVPNHLISNELSDETKVSSILIVTNKKEFLNI